MKKKKFYGFVFALTVLLLATLLFSVLAGRFSISLSELMGIFKARFAGEAHEASMAETVLFGSRLPRIASAALIGCGLSVSGAAYQGIFRNPMASPDLLGASAGAGFGAALGLLLGFSLMAVLLLFRWRLNLLSFGEDEAKALGAQVGRIQAVVIFCATFMTAACVAVGGMVGWVGLIVPHFSRMLVGPDNRRMMPCAALLGAIFLLLVDDVARCLFPQELPIGILTAMVGAPVFIGLLAKGRRGFI